MMMFLTASLVIQASKQAWEELSKAS